MRIAPVKVALYHCQNQNAAGAGQISKHLPRAHRALHLVFSVSVTLTLLPKCAGACGENGSSHSLLRRDKNDTVHGGCCWLNFRGSAS